ncbi:hypothetical protein Hanom_Chr04g00381131 [Helianthus anomalus]
MSASWPREVPCQHVVDFLKLRLRVALVLRIKARQNSFLFLRSLQDRVLHNLFENRDIISD